jgi:hypothetical protein
MPAPPNPYLPAGADAKSALRQGEILSNLHQFRLTIESLGTAPPEGKAHIHPFAIILSQDCDLDQDFRVRAEGKVSDKLIPTILFCEVQTADELYGQIRQIESRLGNRIKNNKEERYQFLQRVGVDSDRLQEGLPELAIDFKRYFTIPTDELYRRIEMGEVKRRCCLNSPYLEHLSSRFAFFLSRVALPEDHQSEPQRGTP